MTHADENKWLAYIQRRLTEAERDELESHLYGCDECLQVFMRCVEQADSIRPPATVLTPQPFDEAVMRRIYGAPASEQAAVAKPRLAPERKSRLPEFACHPLFRYAVAAAITALLMNAGVFESLKGQAEKWQASVPSPQQPSVSGRLAERTSDWLGRLETAMLSRQNYHSEGGMRR